MGEGRCRGGKDVLPRLTKGSGEELGLDVVDIRAMPSVGWETKEGFQVIVIVILDVFPIWLRERGRTVRWLHSVVNDGYLSPHRSRQMIVVTFHALRRYVGRQRKEHATCHLPLATHHSPLAT